MSERDILSGGERVGSSKPSASTPSTKRLSRVDMLAQAVIGLSYAVRAIGQNLDEGPLRTQTLASAHEALTWAKAVQAGRRNRPDRNDARAVAIQARHGDSHESRQSHGDATQVEDTDV